MTKLAKKLSQKKGETLIETLFSMMIAVLAIGLLSTCVMTAANINRSNRDADARFNEQLQKAEGMMTPNMTETNDSSNKVKITFKKGDVELENKKIQNMNVSDRHLMFYAGEETDYFISYKYLP